MRLIAPALLLLLPTALLAQSPRITPAGDPSVKDDTIYKLVVDPAKYPDQPFVYLLDDGVVRLEADGRGTRTYRQVIQLLTREAAEQWGEQSFSYTAGRQKLTVNWVRVLDSTGHVISAKPTHEQESTIPAAETAPVFSDTKVRRVSLGGVAPGTIVDYSYTLETLEPVVPGDFFSSWSVTTGRETRRSRFILDLPASLTPRLRERNLPVARRTEEKGGRRIYTWAAADVIKPKPEPFAADSNPLYASVLYAAPLEWNEIAKWYAGLSRDRYALTPEIEAQLAKELSGATTLDDSLRRAHRWVAQDFRYVSLSLGIGGFRPRTPAEVYATKYGDCKDKATFFVALARRMGVAAYPVLLSSGGGVVRDMASGLQFDHEIAAVDRPQGRLFLDLTSDLTPYGSLPPAEQGEFGLLVKPDGASEQVTFPRDSATANRSEMLLTGTLSPEGKFSGHVVETVSGSQQYSLRNAFTTVWSDEQRERMARSMANGLFEGATGDSLVIFDGRDLMAKPRVSLALHDGKATSGAGGSDILTLPIKTYAMPGLIAELESRKTRVSPIDAERVLGPTETVEEFRVTLPEGWKARLPKPVRAESDWGRYTSEYVQDGRELRVKRAISGTIGVEPPERITALVTWLKAVSADDVKYIVLEH
jgi:transglutaminase-like putative cysteine protease